VADDLFTFLAGVGEHPVVAGDAVGVVLHLDVFASAQGLVAVLAVEALTHGVFLLAGGRIHRHSLAFRHQREDSAGRRREISETQRERAGRREANSFWIYSWEI